MPCVLPDCLSKYSCGEIKRPIDGMVYAPWVEVGFRSAGNTIITVGNQSSPPDNHAVIKSFDYGMSEGQGVEIEIFDEDGGSFEKFSEKLNKSLNTACKDYLMEVDFGWVITDCNGSITTKKVSDYGKKLTFLPITIQANYEQGKIKFVIKGYDFQDRIAETRVEKNEGKDDQKKPLKQAIRDLFGKNPPCIPEIKFLKKDGTTWNFKNSDGGKEGPRGVWRADQQNALATVRKWIGPLRTENNKGILLQWDAANKVPTLILLEDPNPAPDEKNCCKDNLGTYIVNSGGCSSVLSFQPQTSWVFAGLPKRGGNAGGGATGKTVKARGRDKKRYECGGTQTTISSTNGQSDWRPPDNQPTETQKADAAHQDAAMPFEAVYSSIDAELRVQGDPQLAFPLEVLYRSIAIVVINPFHIKKRGNDLCGDWMAEPICNKVYSNRNWLITKISHQIREGTFVTIIKVLLAAPGIELNLGAPVGGCGDEKMGKQSGSDDCESCTC